MPSHSTYACMICRVAIKGSAGQCPGRHAMICMGKHWRAPKKNNKSAWKKLANGIRLWDDKAVQRKAVKQAQHWAHSRQLHKLRKRRLTQSD